MKMRETVTKIALTPAVLLVTAEVHELPTAPTAAWWARHQWGSSTTQISKGLVQTARMMPDRSGAELQIVPTPAALPVPPFEQHWEVFCEARITPGVADG